MIRVQWYKCGTNGSMSESTRMSTLQAVREYENVSFTTLCHLKETFNSLTLKGIETWADIASS
jgi:hypothetical protein